MARFISGELPDQGSIKEDGKEAMNKIRRGTELTGKYNKDRKQTWSVTQTHGLPRNRRQSRGTEMVSRETVQTDEVLCRRRRLGRNKV